MSKKRDIWKVTVLICCTLLIGCAIFICSAYREMPQDLSDDVGKNDLPEQTREKSMPQINKECVRNKSQSEKMEETGYIMKDLDDDVVPTKSLISFDGGETWEYYEHRIKCYFPEENVYRWERYCPENGERQISLDNGITWYYVRENSVDGEIEVSEDKVEWRLMPDIGLWTPILEDDNQFVSYQKTR